MVSGSLALLYFLLGFHGGRQGSGPDRGRSPVEWLGLRPGWMAQRGGRTDERTYGQTNEQTNEQTSGRTENLPILQDFVPYRGRCPASPHENQGERKVGQGNR